METPNFLCLKNQHNFTQASPTSAEALFGADRNTRSYTRTSDSNRGSAASVWAIARRHGCMFPVIAGHTSYAPAPVPGEGVRVHAREDRSSYGFACYFEVRDFGDTGTAETRSAQPDAEPYYSTAVSAGTAGSAERLRERNTETSRGLESTLYQRVRVLSLSSCLYHLASFFLGLRARPRPARLPWRWLRGTTFLSFRLSRSLAEAQRNRERRGEE